MFYFFVLCITDTGLLTPTPLAVLKKEKAYFKMLVKRDKDLEILRKKHEKVLTLAASSRGIVGTVMIYLRTHLFCAVWQVLVERKNTNYHESHLFAKVLFLQICHIQIHKHHWNLCMNSMENPEEETYEC